MTEDVKLDGRSDVELRLEREELYELMLMAHERDITLNQLVEQMLQQYVDEHKKNTEGAHENLDQ
jgi:predicted HicB family RNase H-like nuclease